MKTREEINNMTLAECNEELGAMGEYSMCRDLTEAREALVDATYSYQLGGIEGISVVLDPVEGTWVCVVCDEYRDTNKSKYHCKTIEEAVQRFLRDKNVTIIDVNDFLISPEKIVAVFSA